MIQNLGVSDWHLPKDNVCLSSVDYMCFGRRPFEPGILFRIYRQISVSRATVLPAKTYSPDYASQAVLHAPINLKPRPRLDGITICGLVPGPQARSGLRYMHGHSST